MRKKLLFVAFFLIIICLAFFIFFNAKNKHMAPPIENLTKTHDIPARLHDYAQSVESFIKALKKSRVAIVNNKQADALFFSDEAFIVWRDVLNEFINTPPKEFASDPKWPQNISAVFDSIQAATDLLRNNQMLAGADKLDECRRIINSVYLQNNLQNTDSQLFSILLLVKNVAAAPTLEQSKKELSLLKFDYANIKYLADRNQNKQLFLDFENIISEIDKATQATLGRSQATLMPTFIKIYETSY